MRQKKTQMMLMYTALFAFVVTALLIMAGYIQNRIQGVYQSAGDAIGDGELK